MVFKGELRGDWYRGLLCLGLLGHRLGCGLWRGERSRGRPRVPARGLFPGGIGDPGGPARGPSAPVLSFWSGGFSFFLAISPTFLASRVLSLFGRGGEQ